MHDAHHGYKCRIEKHNKALVAVFEYLIIIDFASASFPLYISSSLTIQIACKVTLLSRTMPSGVPSLSVHILTPSFCHHNGVDFCLEKIGRVKRYVANGSYVTHLSQASWRLYFSQLMAKLKPCISSRTDSLLTARLVP